MGDGVQPAPALPTAEQAATNTVLWARQGRAFAATTDYWARTLVARSFQDRPSMLGGVTMAPAEAAKTLAAQHLDGLPASEREHVLAVLAEEWRAQQEGLHGGNGGPAQTPDSGGTDPVELFSGEFTHEATDLVLRGAGIDFAFHRTYRHQTVYDGPLGHRWDHGYNLSLQINDVSAYLWTGTGRAENYQRHGLWGQTGYYFYLPPDGVHATLSRSGSTRKHRPAGHGVRPTGCATSSCRNPAGRAPTAWRGSRTAGGTTSHSPTRTGASSSAR